MLLFFDRVENKLSIKEEAHFFNSLYLNND